MANISRPFVDPWSGFLLVFQYAAGFAVAAAYFANLLPLWAGFLIATFLMNLSFTTWHEASHGNFSRVVWLNRWLGIVASLYSLYPGYFARRREHLAHHRWEGDAQHDPVYPRIQTGFWAFPLMLSPCKKCCSWCVMRQRTEALFLFLRQT